MKKFILASCIIGVASMSTAVSQESNSKKEYEFTKKIELKYTPVKDQSRSGTCWSFATVSFIESELLRMGKGTFDISEMFFVNHAYGEKGKKYVRMHGASNFGPGGQAHDVFDIIKKHGLVTQEAYAGMHPTEVKHDHGELDAVLEGYLKALVNRKGNLSPVWPKAYQSIINSYLGEIPQQVNYKGKMISPVEFANTLGINPDDYVELTSYNHHPFYKTMALEIPDNWSNGLYYNIPVEDLIETINNALSKGYTVCWDGDVSDKGFSHANSLAIIPEMQPVSNEGSEMAKWEKMSEKDRGALVYNFKEPRQEKLITQDMRQEAFDNYQATDDHLMHIVGTVKDQNNKEYFIIKNSWADNSNSTGGLLYMSEAFVRLNTVAIMVHKDALPNSIKIKLGLDNIKL